MFIQSFIPTCLNKAFFYSSWLKRALLVCLLLGVAGCGRETESESTSAPVESAAPVSSAETLPTQPLVDSALLPSVDRAIPDFSLQGMNGDVIDTASLQGKTWLINFWAVWCAPCLEELPSLNSAWEELAPHDIGMLAINIGEEPDQIETFLAEHNLAIDFPIVIGDKIRTLSNWSARALPHTVVISPKGRVVFEVSGPREWDDQSIIDAIIAVAGES